MPFFRKLQKHVPEDVPEGHFVVLATDGEDVERFVVKLQYLSEPAFLRLLEKAGEEFGFRQNGALTVPCRPHELQRILQCRRRKPRGCGPCNVPVVDSF